MFQQQAREMLGDNFMNEAYGPGGLPRNSSRQGSARAQPAAGAPPPQPDMGILKALNSMGSAAKRNLTQLAQGFNSNSSNSNNAAPTSSRGGFGGGSPPPTSGAVRRGSGSSRRKKGAFDDLDDVSDDNCKWFVPLVPDNLSFCLSILTGRMKKEPRLSPSRGQNQVVGAAICCRTMARRATTITTMRTRTWTARTIARTRCCSTSPPITSTSTKNKNKCIL